MYEILDKYIPECSIHQQIWRTQQWPQDRKRSVFIPIPKKGNAKECSHHHTIALISYVSKFGKLSSGHRTRKGPFSFQSQRKVMAKNAQTTTQLHSSLTLVK